MKRIIATIIVVLAMTVFAGTVFAKTGTVNTQGLNLRDGATTIDTNILKKLDKGVTVNIIEELNGWYKITYENFEGYVNQDFIDVSTEAVEPNEPVTGTTTQPIVEPESKMIADADVYILPLISSTKIAKISNGTKVTIISETVNWKYVQTPNVCGWVIGSKVDGHKVVSTSTQVDNNQSGENNTKENEVVQYNNATVQNVSNNENVVSQTNNTAEQNVTSSGNNNPSGENGGSSNNNSGTQTGTTTPTSFPATMYVNVDAVNIRASASTSAEVVASVGINTPVTVKGIDDDWYSVEVSDGKGYMKKEYLSTTRTE